MVGAESAAKQKYSSLLQKNLLTDKRWESGQDHDWPELSESFRPNTAVPANADPASHNQSSL